MGHVGKTVTQNIVSGATNLNNNVTLGGTTPTLTIGDAGAEDAKLVFDGNALDFHIGLDDSADTLNIGKGSALGTTTHISCDTNGFVSRPQTPAVQATKNSTTQTQTISGSNVYVITGLDSSYGNSHSVNNKSYFDSSTSRFLVPAGTATGYYFCSLQTIFGIERPSSGTNWGYLGIRKNNTQSGLSNNTFAEAYREVVSTSGVATTVWETMNCHGVIQLAEYDYVEPIFGGSDGEDMKIHPGNYTNFSVIQIA